MNSDTVDMSRGAILAVYCSGDSNDMTNFSVNFNTTAIEMESFI